MTAAYVNAFNFDVRNHEVTAFATIYATAVGQRAYEYTEKKQGYFTWAVVEALKGGAANDKGEVTLAGLIKYLQETVPKRVAIDLGAGKQQRPFWEMEGYKAEDLIIAVSHPALANASQPTASTSVDPTAFELSYWETIKNSTNPDDFKSYLEKYPGGQFAALAKNRINNLDSATRRESKPAADNAAEMTFWQSIQASNNADDFKAYLAKFPNGTFAELANNRLKSLNSAARWPVVSSGPKSFRGLYGKTLVVSPNSIEIVERDGKRQNYECSAFAATKVEYQYQIPSVFGFSCPQNGSCRFDTFTMPDAAAALNYIHAVCKSLAAFVTVTETGPSDPLGGTVWKGTSPGHDKQYEFEFVASGGVAMETRVGKYDFLYRGTWKRAGNVISMELKSPLSKQSLPVEVTVTGDTMTGNYDKGKYQFTLTKLQ